jgi:ribosome-associated heat shock protein Hsp15
MSPPEDPAAPVRVDKWLWAARLAKTRSLAADAVKGGRVHVNGNAVKASRELKPGDRVEVTTGPVPITVEVRATSERRGPAVEAVKLYAETEASRAARERHAEQRRLTGPERAARGPRPTKRDRRRLEDARGRRR